MEIQAGIGPFHITIKIKSNLVAAGMLGAGLLTLRSFYIANPREVTSAVKTVLTTWAAYVLSIRPSCILVEFVCNTEERYEAFMSALAAGTIKQRLQEEFSKIGFEGDLEVTIVDDDNAPQQRERNLAMSEAAAQTGFPEGSLSNPPEVDVALLKPLDLPKRFVEWKDVHLPIDILLLTMKECEFFSCLSYLNPDYYRSLNRKVGYVYLGEMGDGEEKLKVAVILCHGGFEIAGGGTTVTMVVFEALCALRPKAVICVGYCAGLKGKNVKLGDVIISSKLATYAPTKVTAGNMIERGVRVLGSPLLSGILKSADHGWKAPLKNPNDLEVEVHKDGLLLSGPEVVSSDKSRMELIKRYPDAIGVEMEGEGLYPFVLDLPTEWVVIKGVSHYAGDNNSESDPWRQFSSLMAASLVAHILSNAKVFQKLPHYKKPGI